ncbi:ECF transporter S component [Emergencia timonensis]|uniref:ECF transporter S component n=2 Tax=Emergencia timonensis TaxID=1776384 RepID=A0A415DUP6_9FIRM|nr:ECF transporter S component [Emergencia timonensis]RHJ83762.1 ECF transporter S component [Emergencia timonensis]
MKQVRIMIRNENDNKITAIVMTGLMMCLIMVATMFIKLPIPFTQGYVHLGDSMIFLSILVLGKKNGSIAAGVGSAMGDIIGGYAFWAPWTLVIKFLMAFLMGAFVEHMEKKGRNNTGSFGISAMEIVGMVIAGIEMVVGYYIASAVMYGNLLVPVPSIPWNVGQFAVGMVIASIIASALCKTPAKKYFAIK